MSKSIFLLDANVLIEAHKRYYSFDIAPAFWSAAKQNAQVGKILSIDRIQQELNEYADDDHLKTWANTEFSEWFLSTQHDDIFMAYAEVMSWATEQGQFTEGAKAEFAEVADGWLVACAKARNFVVVTHEVYNEQVKNRIPIPNVCRALNVPHINTFEMLRRLNVKLG
ncbi:MAG: DUF4411 family protein [Thermaerobacter sp.]|nr:DUF4411 family protein [Thermaerobacter sp.]